MAINENGSAGEPDEGPDEVGSPTGSLPGERFNQSDVNSDTTPDPGGHGDEPDQDEDLNLEAAFESLRRFLPDQMNVVGEPPFEWHEDQDLPVPFEQLVTAYGWNRDPTNADSRFDMDLGFRLYSRATQAIPDAYYLSPVFPGGVALVWKWDERRKTGPLGWFRRMGLASVEGEERLDLEYWVDGMLLSRTGPRFSSVGFKIGDLRDRLKSLPDSGARQTGIRRLYQIIQFLFGVLEDVIMTSSRGGDSEDDVDDYEERYSLALESIDHEVEAADEFYRSAFERIGQGEYVRGMFRGLTWTLVVAVIIALAGPWVIERIFEVSIQGSGFQALLAALIAGALGGVLSVMIRFSRNRLTIRPDVDMRRVRQLGAFRPVVGSMFAVAILVIVVAGLIPQLNLTQNEIAFFAAVGFLAGFSERWATDVVTLAQNNVTPPSP